MVDHDFILRVLTVMAECDTHSDLFWNVEEGVPHFFINCNDLFFWATADAEDLTPENLNEFKMAWDDAKAAGHEGYASDLFCARMRKMRPQKPYYEQVIKDKPAIISLFNDCGLPRED